MPHTAIESIHPTTERIERWADALESGTYRQGTGALTSTVGHCCWGVACKLAVQDGVLVTRQNPDTPAYTEYAWKNDDGTVPDESRWVSIMPPEDFYAWMGIDGDQTVGEISTLSSRSIPNHLAHMNDNGSTFTEIATEIRELLLPKTTPDA